MRNGDEQTSPDCEMRHDDVQNRHSGDQQPAADLGDVEEGVVHA